MFKSKTINGDIVKSIVGGIFFCYMIGMSFGVDSAQAATYTAKVSKCHNGTAWVTCDGSSPSMSGTLNCGDSSTPASWYKDRGRRCGEIAGIAYWNSDLAKTSATKLPLDCGNTTPPAAWYAGKGRCGDTDGLNWWNNDLKTQPASVVQTTFNTAYSQNCGALSNDACNDKFLCQSGYDYVSNTATCKILASTVMGSFDTAYNQNCSNMAGTTNHDLCNDILLCKPGDDYLTNTDKCQTAACVPTNSACAANTYFGQSCWDGCAFIAGTKSYNCAGSIPAGYTMCASDDIGLTSSLSWLGAGATSSSCTAARKCEYYGSGGGGGGGSFACSGSIPAGYTMCASDDTGLTSNLPWLVSGATSSTCTAARKCEYYGNGGGGGGSFSCTDNPPAGASFCPGDDTGLTSNLSWKQVASCTGARKCEYVWNCAPNIVTPGFKECAP